MRSLGVNSKGSNSWLVCAEDGKLLSTEPQSLTPALGMELGDRLAGLLDECERVLRALSPAYVLILEPEATSRLTFEQSKARLAVETILALAAAREGVPCDRLPRPTLRSKLGLPKSGKLSSLVDGVVSEPLSPNWNDKRDLAALAALAGQRWGTDVEG